MSCESGEGEEGGDELDEDEGDRVGGVEGWWVLGGSWLSGCCGSDAALLGELSGNEGEDGR